MAAPQPLALEYEVRGQGSGWRKGQELIDALPYIDLLSPEVKRKVEQLIEEELARSSKKPSDYLKELPPIAPPKFEGHPLLQQEYERVKSSQPLQPLDTSRYRLDPPPQARRNDYSAWRSALDNAHAQLEHQLLRIDNLELALKYSANNWRAQVQVDEAAVKRLEEELAATRKAVDHINRERKMQQHSTGVELKRCEEEWMSLVMKNANIERACCQLEEEVERLQAQVSALAPPNVDPAAAAGGGGASVAPHQNGVEGSVGGGDSNGGGEAVPEDPGSKEVGQQQGDGAGGGAVNGTQGEGESPAGGGEAAAAANHSDTNGVPMEEDGPAVVSVNQ